ncbi:MAG: hypothetical protein WBF42_08240 [Terracidiphilus sp.]
MPKLIGLDWDAEEAWEIRSKGWYELAELQLDDGSVVPLSFRDPVRLSQELQAHFASGKQYFSKRNLIILPELTEEAIRQTVADLLFKGVFKASGPDLLP